MESVLSDVLGAEHSRGGKMSQGPQHVLQRKIGLFSATNLVMANMVGTGIFTTSGFIMGKLQDPTTLLLCWLAGDIGVMWGALLCGTGGQLSSSRWRIRFFAP